MINRYRIDTHQHIVPDVYRAALGRIGVSGSGERAWPDWSVDSALEVMDRAGIETAMTSIASPGTYFGDIEFTKRLVRECNDASRSAPFLTWPSRRTSSSVRTIRLRSPMRSKSWWRRSREFRRV